MNCCQPAQSCCNSKREKKRITIDFLYLDLDTCTRCQGTEGSLDSALSEVARVLKMTGMEVILNKIHIDSEEKAIQYRFLSSPTIRINGRDVQLQVRESQCQSCGDLCGEEVDCRVWIYQGKEYEVPPAGMIVDAILREVYSNNGASQEEWNREYSLPDNLKKFFAARSRKTGGE